MSSTTIQTIRTLIIAKLNSLVIDSDDPIFHQVIGYADGNFTGYPSAVVIPTGGEGEVKDTHRNARHFNFEIRLYQEIGETNKDKSASDEAMAEVTDAVVAAFDQDKDLGNQVEIVRVVSWETSFGSRPGAFIFATIQVRVSVLVPSYA